MTDRCPSNVATITAKNKCKVSLQTYNRVKLRMIRMERTPEQPLHKHVQKRITEIQIVKGLLQSPMGTANTAVELLYQVPQ